MFKEGEIDPNANIKAIEANVDRDARFAEKVKIEKGLEEARLEKLASDKREAENDGNLEKVKALSEEFAKEVVRKQLAELTRKK